MLERDPSSHKGDNGKIMIVAGSPLFHGAPILCSLAAEHSGVDLVYPFISPTQKEAAKSYSLNFILQSFEDDILTTKDVRTIVNFSKNVDCVVIGPGLGSDGRTKRAIKSILAQLTCPTVIDAHALMYTNHLPPISVLTPHHGEFKMLSGEEPTPDSVQKLAKNLNAIIVCKGAEDIIASPDQIAINNTGNALMTVGGTGDVLAGFIGGLMAQHVDPFHACKQATRILGLIAEDLAELESNVRAADLAYGIPTSMKIHYD